MSLKYQSEIDALGLTFCPDAVVPETEIEAFRFSFNPIENELNFVPNVIFDRQRNSPFNYEKATAEKKCLRCGASFYLNLESAINKWNNISERIRELLGYTHIANGKLDSNDGLMRVPDITGHFTFYELETANLTTKFNLISEL